MTFRHTFRSFIRDHTLDTPAKTEYNHTSVLYKKGTIIMRETRAIALTGGVGSGKSRILELLEKEYKVLIIQTDHVAKMLEEPGQAGFEALIDAFGRELMGGDGKLKKDVLTKMVFTDADARRRIDQLIHPLVWEYVRARIMETKSAVAVVESALILENPGDFFQEIWYVYTLREERVRRLMESRGYSAERCYLMMEGQPSEEEYRKHADFVIDNNGPLKAVKEQIDKRLVLPDGNTTQYGKGRRSP